VARRPLPVDDPRRRRPDITRARQLLGWSRRVALAAGLRATIDWFAAERRHSAAGPAVAAPDDAALVHAGLSLARPAEARPAE
jgi:UDP-glucuronate decarboxylase